ncbi:MAG: alpha/beta hydrolase [Actinomycetota bacterium]|nr:alpha/beta hydrolase [Actinomycetota bacterium]
MARTPDTRSVIAAPGPWRHRYLAANGARFHVAESLPASGGDAPLVLLLHGFPEFWWSWRAQLPVLAKADYRAVAMDLRGYGGSDKPPRGYDPFTLAGDVSGVIKALGARSAALVGHGWGGYVGWATSALHPQEVSMLCAVSAPHPQAMLRDLRSGRRMRALQHIVSMQVPMVPEWRLSDPARGFLRSHLTSWSSPDSSFPDDDTVAAYQQALSLWPAPHCALEYHRWLVRSRLRSDGRRFNQVMAAPTSQPVCTIHGTDDPALAANTSARSAQHVRGTFSHQLVARAGHFPHEEQPEAFNDVLLGWLGH